MKQQQRLVLVLIVCWANIHQAVARSPDQRRYRTAYACEGSTLSLGCDAGEVINLVRANYGRFSITICNEHGDTDWSVNCMSNRSLRVLHTKCNQQNNCSVLASTTVFGDPCPGTLKYLEAHYQCLPASSASSTPRPRPPWFTSVGPSLWNNLFQNNSSVPANVSSTTEPTVANSSGIVVETLPETGIVEESEKLPDNGTDVVAPETATATITSTTPTTTASTTTVASGAAGPVIIEITEVTVMVPDFPGKATTPRATTTVAVPPSQEADDNHEEGEKEEEEEFDETTEEEGGEEEDNVSDDRTLTTTAVAPHTTRSRVSSVLPSSDDSTYCPPTVTRGLYWNWTKSGDSVVQPCPGGATGYARWQCAGSGSSGASPAAWFPAAPDLSNCKSVWLTSLESRLHDGDSVISISSDLAQVTNSKTLYGGDLAAATKLLRQMAHRMAADLQAFPDWRQREAIVTELIQNVMQAGSNLLAASQSLAWRDLGVSVARGVYDTESKDAQARKTATDLLTALEENAFLMANTFARQKMAVQTFENILMSVQVLDSRNVARDLVFPVEEDTLMWNSRENSIVLPAQSLRENTDGGLVRVVLFSYQHMEDILSPYIQPLPVLAGTRKNVTKIVNSRVISASLGKGRHIQLSRPVSLTLQHLRLDDVSNPSCVFWDYSVSAWSEEGCRVVSTNRSHTVCSCDHLTNFAILMDLDLSPGIAGDSASYASVAVYAGCGISLLCLLCCIVHLIFFKSKLRKELSKFLQNHGCFQKDISSSSGSTGKDNGSFYGNQTSAMAPPPTTYWKGNSGNDQDVVTPRTESVSQVNRSSSLRSSRTLRSSGRDQKNHSHQQNSFVNVENETSTNEIPSSKLLFQPVSSLRSSMTAHPQQLPGSVRRSLHPHPVPNPALAEGAALDAQLIAQFRSTQKRSVSPWNHTYTEIDPRSSLSYTEEYGFEPRLHAADPVYEEIERREFMCRAANHHHHFQQGSETSDEDGRRQNSDVSRQSSRSYGDNRPLISLHHSHHHGPHHDLLTTISYAFNSPHMRPKHSHAHQGHHQVEVPPPHPETFSGLVSGTFMQYPHENTALSRTVPLRVSNKLNHRPNLPNNAP